MKKALSIILTVIFVATCPIMTGFAENAVETDENDSNFTNEQEHERDYYLPGNMRGAFLRFDSNGQDGEIGAIPEETFDYLASLGMNTVIIQTSDSENIFYNTDMNKSKSGGDDYLALAVESARKRGFNVFLTFDINTVLYNSDCESLRVSLNSLITEVHKFTLKYPCDGIILDNYYSVRDGDSFKSYMGYGAGIGYDNWLYDSTESFFKTAAEIIRMSDNSIPVGIMLNDFSHIGHSNGFADLGGFIASGYADFALLNARDSLTTSAVDLPFKEFAEHWGAICSENDVPMYINHHNQKIGRGDSGPGWNGEDQLLRQLALAKDTPAYKGSVFNSHPDLAENRLNSTETLKLFFNDQINEQTLFDDLTMHSPNYVNFATNDSIAVFQGTYDDNFDVFLNEAKITLNEAGNFYIEKPLNVGMNYFTLKHKGKVITYSIERRVVSLHSIDDSIANGKILEVEGGTIITVGAIAYRGATVTATLGGQTVRLTQQEHNLDDPALNASYAAFVGRITVPSGMVGQVQNLGTINISANLSGYVRNATGASVLLTALPEPPPPPPPVDLPIIDDDNPGSGEVVGRIGAIRGNDVAVRYVRTLNNNTAVLPGNTTGAISVPIYSRLPAGTIDYFRATVGNYHTTENGRRISAEDAVVENGVGMGENALEMLSGGTSGRNSFFRISLTHRSSFSVTAAGLNYTTAWDGEYNVSDFNATHIYIDFDNVTSVTSLPSFENNHVFSSGKWETPTVGGVPKFRLVLELRRRGIYGGNYAYYNAEGELMLTFPVMSSSLSGKTIVIDPGHGVTATGFDPGAIGHVREYDVVISVARKLQSQLNALGANAVILPTDSEFVPSRERPNRARAHNADLYIALHCNAITGNANAKGTEVWYFTPFSQPLASEISSNVAVYFRDNVYADRVLRNRGAKYSYYWVTLAQDFPSVLVELGFVTNYEDAMAMASDAHQNGIAGAIAEGVRRYFGRAG